MPIGSVDYTSTVPWNDPYNPWPAYAQVTLSASNVSLAIFTMTQFDPLASIPNIICTYTDASNRTLFLDNGSFATNQLTWIVSSNATLAGILYYKATPPFVQASRGIPVKSAGIAGGWSAIGGGVAASLYIQPVITSLTPWELRRRRLLENV